jgi:hypothetical protein
LRRSCDIPHCFFGSANNEECLVCNNRNTNLKLFDDFIDDNAEFFYDNGFVDFLDGEYNPFQFEL